MPSISRANYSDSSNKKSKGSTISTSTSTSNNKRNSTYCRSKRKKIIEYGIIILLTLGIQHSLLFDEIGTSTTNTGRHTNNNNDNNFELEIIKKSSNIIYGHLHFPSKYNRKGKSIVVALQIKVNQIKLKLKAQVIFNNNTSRVKISSI